VALAVAAAALIVDALRSGDPAHFVRRAKEVYDALGVDSRQKFVVFSDGLNVARCLELQKVAQDVDIGASFGACSRVEAPNPLAHAGHRHRHVAYKRLRRCLLAIARG
jgi:nicotinic acid phosphoribosyltransferase